MPACDECGGMGWYYLMPDGERVECSMCEGTGEFPGTTITQITQDEALAMLEKLRPKGST